VSVVSHRCGTLPAVRRKLRASLSLLLMPLPAAGSGTPTSHSAATATLRSPESSPAHPAPSAAAKPTRAAVSAAATIAASTGAAAALAELPVKGRAPMTGHRRDRFGPAWADANSDGCDTRTICIRSLPGATLPQ
jgi:hypothetical protein